MELATLERLLDPPGQRILHAAMNLEPSDATFLSCYEKLRKLGSSDLVKAAVETAILRRKAAAKFPNASRMYFTREALEQSSSWTVASYRMQRFASFHTVADCCCGIGGDTMALSARVPNVMAFDSDPLKARMAQMNVHQFNAHQSHVFCTDILQDEIPPFDAFFCDPSRRNEGRRLLSLHDYLPAPPDVLQRFPNRPCAFKLAPGIPREELLEIDGEIEYISLAGELKECILWIGMQTCRYRATALPSGLSMAAMEPDEAPPTGAVQRYIYDPDPALTRSGLVTNFANSLQGRLLDAGLAFITSDQCLTTPFATVYEVCEVLPFHAKRNGAWFREQKIGRVTIVKRGSSANADELQKLWKLKGDQHRDVLLTRIDGQSVAIVAKRIGS